MIRFRATEAQLQEMAVRTFMAASPVGMGFLHYRADHVKTAEDFPIQPGNVALDYVEGRQIKLIILRDDDEPGVWKTPSLPPESGYNSWAGVYPETSLIDLVGGEIVP